MSKSKSKSLERRAFETWREVWRRNDCPFDDPERAARWASDLDEEAWLGWKARAALASPAAEPVQALTDEQIRRLYANAPDAARDANSRAAFIRLWRLFESVALASHPATKEAKAEPVLWAIFDSQGFYETREFESEAKEFCDHYNKREVDPLKPYTYRALIVAPEGAA